MIVTCPSCNAKYKIDASKIKGRGAKITCPNCAHKFVVMREGEEGAASAAPGVPPDLARRDFRQVGIVWKVRKGIGLTYEFNDLATLREYLDDGQIDERDVITWDMKDWRPIEQVGNLEAYFYDVWRRAEAGDIVTPQVSASTESSDEDESDAPTTIVGHGSSLADEIRKAVQEATTPAPAPERSPAALPTGPAAAPAQAATAPAAATSPAAAKAPDPFANLERKAKQEQGGMGMMPIAVVVVALLVLIPVMLWALGVFGHGTP